MASGPVNKTNSQSPSAAGVLSNLSTGKSQDAEAAKKVMGAKEGKGATKSDGKGAAASDVQISAGAKGRADAMQKAYDIAASTPDIREDRVAALKKQINDGTYKADAGNIADGMLREAVKDHLSQVEER